MNKAAEPRRRRSKRCGPILDVIGLAHHHTDFILDRHAPILCTGGDGRGEYEDERSKSGSRGLLQGTDDKLPLEKRQQD